MVSVGSGGSEHHQLNGLSFKGHLGPMPTLGDGHTAAGVPEIVVDGQVLEVDGINALAAEGYHMSINNRVRINAGGHHGQ